MKYQNILIVDDSKTSRLIVKRCFEMAGYSDAVFLEAPDGADALDTLQTQSIDLVVTDLKMPRVDGLTLVRKMRSSGLTNNIPVVVISSIAEANEHEALLHDHVLARIQKPLSPAKLMHALEEV